MGNLTAVFDLCGDLISDPDADPHLEAAATPAITTAITADRTSAAPLNVPPSRIADWATGDISAPNCSYTFEK